MWFISKQLKNAKKKEKKYKKNYDIKAAATQFRTFEPQVFKKLYYY